MDNTEASAREQTTLADQATDDIGIVQSWNQLDLLGTTQVTTTPTTAEAAMKPMMPNRAKESLSPISLGDLVGPNLIPEWHVVQVRVDNVVFGGRLTKQGINRGGTIYATPSQFSVYVKQKMHPTLTDDEGWTSVTVNDTPLCVFRDLFAAGELNHIGGLFSTGMRGALADSFCDWGDNAEEYDQDLASDADDIPEAVEGDRNSDGSEYADMLNSPGALTLEEWDLKLATREL